VFKCDQRFPADTTKNYDAVKPELIREVMDKKVRLEIRTAFEELKKQAHPNLLLAGVHRETNVTEEVNRAMEQPGMAPHPGVVPAGK